MYQAGPVRTLVVVKRIAAAVAALSVLVLTGCSSSDDTPSTQPVVAVSDQPAAAVEVERQAVTPAPTEDAAPAAWGEDVEVGDKGTMKIRPLDQPGVYAVEVYTNGLQEFPGSFTGTDSAGVEHVAVRLGAEQFAAGGPGRAELTGNGYAGDQLTFDTTDIASVTYTPAEGEPLTWSVG